MSAIRFFRSRTARAFVFAPRAHITTRLAFQPQYLFTERKKERMIKRCGDSIRAAMANPKLDGTQRYRVAERNFAFIDCLQAFYETTVLHQKYTDAHQRAWKDAVKGEMLAMGKHCKVLADIVQGELVVLRKLPTLFWQACRLHTFAPRGEVRIPVRIAHFALLLFLKLNVPVALFGLRIVLGIMRSLERRL